MKKMTKTAQMSANGGLKCYKCGRFFAFLPGWEKRYNKHVKSCVKGNFWLS